MFETNITGKNFYEEKSHQNRCDVYFTSYYALLQAFLQVISAA